MRNRAEKTVNCVSISKMYIMDCYASHLLERVISSKLGMLLYPRILLCFGSVTTVVVVLS